MENRQISLAGLGWMGVSPSEVAVMEVEFMAR